MTAPILVTGATGSVGSSVVDQLMAAGAPVRASARRPAALDLPDDVERVELDLVRPGTFGPALAGVRSVFLYVQPAGLDAFLAAAARAGVEHLVVLSSQTVNEHISGREAIAAMHKAVEQKVVDSGLPCTFVRPGHFATNALLWGWAAQLRAGDVLRFPYPDLENAAIHEKDIAAVAVTALVEPGDQGQAYFVTGPESISQRRQLADIAAATGRSLQFVELSPEETRPMLLRQMPEWVTDAMLLSWQASNGVPAEVSDGVEKVTGRPARPFAEWAADHAKDFG